MAKYAPLPASSLVYLARLLGYGAPQLGTDTRSALNTAREHLASARSTASLVLARRREPRIARHAPDDSVRLLAPFDPIVWDRPRFQLLWGWRYRFEAYTPASQRKLGYYALPLLWGDRVIGWGNLTNGGDEPQFGYADSRVPRDRAFRRELSAELDRMQQFLGRSADR